VARPTLRNVPRKRRSTYGLHDVVSQKMETFITATENHKSYIRVNHSETFTWTFAFSWSQQETGRVCFQHSWRQEPGSGMLRHCLLVRYAIHNFRDWCWHLYSCCSSSVMQRQMIVLAGCADCLHPIIRSRVPGLMRFQDGSDRETA
jgi:hypothetical protein